MYRPKRSWTAFGGIGGAVVMAAGIAIAIPGVVDMHGLELWLQVAVGVLLAVAGGASVATVAGERIILFEDAIEVRHLVHGHRRARRDQIRGARVLPTRELVLELAPGTKPIKVRGRYEIDAELDAWVGSLPDFGAEESARAVAELLARTELGPTEDDRVSALAKARRIARVVEGAGLLVSIWGIVFPRPYPVVLAMLAALPVLAMSIVATGRGIYQLERGGNDPRPTIGISLAMPGLALAIRATTDVQVLDVWTLVPWIPAIVLPFVAISVAAERGARLRWRNGLLMAGVMVAYGWGTLVLADVRFDRAPRETHRVEVLGKRVTAGQHPAPQLELAPWGPVEERDFYPVSRALHRATEVGSQVCLELGEGALGARWYAIRACAPD